MAGSSSHLIVLALVCLWITGCNGFNGKPESQFDKLQKTVTVGNWKYDLYVENQNDKSGTVPNETTTHFLKATLSIGNSKTNKSLLYSASRDVEDYEVKYKYLAFSSGEDLYIKYKNEIIRPIGYVFEPSNGLSPSERLVYKFMLSSEQYKAMKKNKNIEYWYTDHLIGLGKVCFNVNN